MNFLDMLEAEKARFYKKSDTALDSVIKDLSQLQTEKEERDKAIQEGIAEIDQAVEDAKSEAEKQADSDWSSSGQKFGNLVDDEPEAIKPVQRSVRADGSTRSFGVGHDEEEESEPYRRPQHRDDEDTPEPAKTAEPVPRTAKHSWDDEEEEDTAYARSPSRDSDWGGSTRRIGNHGDDEDD